MINLATEYLVLTLRSLLIVTSSGLTDNIDKLTIAEESGAGAVVLKSLFEEEISYHAGELAGTTDYPGAEDYINQYTKSHSLDNYLKLIGDAKSKLSIPVIPSINCVSSDDWVDFARNIESAGADALEINLYFLPVDKTLSSVNAEKLYFDLTERLKGTINIPIALKIGPRFTNLLYMIDQFYTRGINGVVLFNRFYEPDIDINSVRIIPASVFSAPEDKRYVLRWIAMTNAAVGNISLAATTGVHDGRDAIKYLLAGADAVQVCSILYKKGIEFIKEMTESIEKWMSEKRFDTVSDFRGKLNYRNVKEPEKYERSQFMKYFSSYE
ncbi:MAG: dihydroorotate dehydrogenase-like protein [Bacteroidales bacterium]|nr:dihydroorotate dehydrogenase-like protein [Bacteroidales bacterium]